MILLMLSELDSFGRPGAVAVISKRCNLAKPVATLKDLI